MTTQTAQTAFTVEELMAMLKEKGVTSTQLQEATETTRKEEREALEKELQVKKIKFMEYLKKGMKLYDEFAKELGYSGFVVQVKEDKTILIEYKGSIAAHKEIMDIIKEGDKGWSGRGLMPQWVRVALRHLPKYQGKTDNDVMKGFSEGKESDLKELFMAYPQYKP